VQPELADYVSRTAGHGLLIGESEAFARQFLDYALQFEARRYSRDSATDNPARRQN